MAIFPSGPGLPVLLELRMMEVVVTSDMQSFSQLVTTNISTPSFLQAGCPSCRPTNSVKALKGNAEK